MITTHKNEPNHPGSSDRELVDVRDMFVVHTALLREFRLIPAVVRATPADDRRRAGNLAAHLEFLDGLVHHHHAGEDELVWPRLRERTPAATAVLDIVDDQHRRIAGALRDVREAKAVWVVVTDETTTTALADALEVLDGLLRVHLELEERELLPLAASVLTQAEWDAVGEAAVASMPKPALVLAFGMFSYEGDPAVLKGMLASAPLVPRHLLPRIAPRVYARRARRIHGTARP